MRKIADSGNASCNRRLSARAEARSCPNGFSTTTRAPRLSPVALRLLMTSWNMAGGTAR